MFRMLYIRIQTLISLHKNVLKEIEKQSSGRRDESAKEEGRVVEETGSALTMTMGENVPGKDSEGGRGSHGVTHILFAAKMYLHLIILYTISASSSFICLASSCTASIWCPPRRVWWIP